MEASLGVSAWFGTLFLWTLGSAAAVWVACRLAIVRRSSRRE
ncbi:hypothetical protein [Desulfosoma sp.]